MVGKRQFSRRNQRMDLYKGIAIYAVVFIHVLFPGRFGEAVRAVARFAVPWFFLTAGYFSFRASARTLGRRGLRTLGLLALAGVLYFCLGCLLALKDGERVALWIRGIFSRTMAEEFFFFHTVPFPYAWQLWFLGALFLVYLLWWAVTVLFERLGRGIPYPALGAVAVVLLCVHLVLGEGFGLLGKEMDNRLLRNAMLDGFPFFALGAWAAFRRRSIRASRLPWHGLILLGTVLSVVESRFAGRQELYLGTCLLLAGMMGRCIRYRRASQGRLSRGLQFCGQELTLDIFVLHMLVVAAVREVPALAWLNGLTWLLPPAVAAVSTLLALLAAWARANFRRERDFV